MSTYPGQPDPSNAGDQPPYGGGGQPSYPGQPGYGAPYGGMPSDPTEKNWMGIAALVFGALSLCCNLLTAIPAVIFGVLGIQEASQGRANNKSLSATGIALAIILTIVNFVLGFLTGSFNNYMNS